MFKGFQEKFIKVKKGKIFCRIAGNGPPLLLLHGYPQTHVMWHKTAPELSKYFSIIAADLRGYGSSMVLPSDLMHENYSKREMAGDMAQLMEALGHDKFFIAGHDRGGRVAHRLARDYRQRVIAMSVLDICPTLDMYESTDMEFARSYFHWYFLIQPKGLPEKMIQSDPRAWLDSCLQKWSGGHEFGQAEEKYLAAFSQPERIHASCEDYRAAASIDLEHDIADRDYLLNIPIQVLWGEQGIIGRKFFPIKVWQSYTTESVIGNAMSTGHFIPEEDPMNTVNKLKNFFISSNL
jgi:haloacetate dehalogenase